MATWTDRRLEKALGLRAEGRSAQYIAYELGVSRGAVCGKLWRTDHPVPAKPRSESKAGRRVACWLRAETLERVATYMADAELTTSGALRDLVEYGLESLADDSLIHREDAELRDLIARAAGILAHRGEPNDVETMLRRVGARVACKPFAEAA